jgi:hypothetical protein
MAWQRVGAVSISAGDVQVVVGTVQIPAAGGLEVRIKQTGPADQGPFYSGLFFVRTTAGRTLGTRKFWGNPEGEDYRYGEGLVSEESTGEFVIEPRLLNRKVLAAHPGRTWNLEVWVNPAVANPPGSGEGFFIGGFASTAGAGLEMARVVFP